MLEQVDELKRKLALTYQILYMEGIAAADTLGHVSARMPGTEVVYMKGWGLGFEEVTPDNLLAMDLEGHYVSGEGRLHSERPMHTEIYKARPDVSSVFHGHPFYSTLLSGIWMGKFSLVNQETQQFCQGLAFYESFQLVRTQEQGRAVAEALGQGLALLMKNHGIVTAGESIEQVLFLTLQLERAARTQITLGPFQDVQEADPAACVPQADEFAKERSCNSRFEYYCRKLKREGNWLGPDWSW